MRRPTLEMILAGVMLVLIGAFVVYYGWMLVQIDTVGVNETVSASVSTDEDTEDTGTASALTSPGAAPSAATGSTGAAPGGPAARTSPAAEDESMGIGGRGLRRAGFEDEN